MFFHELRWVLGIHLTMYISVFGHLCWQDINLITSVYLLCPQISIEPTVHCPILKQHTVAIVLLGCLVMFAQDKKSETILQPSWTTHAIPSPHHQVRLVASSSLTSIQLWHNCHNKQLSHPQKHHGCNHLHKSMRKWQSGSSPKLLIANSNASYWGSNVSSNKTDPNLKGTMVLR